MTSVFGKLKKTIDKGVATVSVKSNVMIETNKIKVHMNSLKDKIARKKTELGEIMYMMYLEEEIDQETVTTICEEITSLSDQLKEKEEEIRKIKEEEVEILGSQQRGQECTCGNIVPEGFSFCTECGEKLG